ncbi:DNA-methyltransferase [Kocuria rosea]|uniref:DNA-methyltransferase n=1 Tax=Kocuria rosea TaxID=1275 RepID=UPI001C92F942|nr:site-specific DNA-methyltransferase [Kocuria rosea]
MTNFTDDQKVYVTPRGTQMHGDSLELLGALDDETVDLIVTSPPFALQRKKAYGNENQEAYVDWLAQFGQAAKRVLKPTGSLVIDLGNAYRQGSPTRSLYPYRVLLKFVDELEYHLAEEFFWYNPAKLPSPLEWVNKRRIRVKDAVNTVWWFSKTEWPQADVNQVLLPYSKNMQRLLKDPEKYYKATLRPSEHSISKHFGTNNGGAIPSNLLQIPNTDSSSAYLKKCRALGIKSHPARFPANLPKFFIEFLTNPGDLVVDIFSGSNTTGMVAERLGRRWYSFELSRDYAALSIMRFLPGLAPQDAGKLYDEAKLRTVSLPEEGRSLLATMAKTLEEDADKAVAAAEEALAIAVEDHLEAKGRRKKAKDASREVLIVGPTDLVEIADAALARAEEDLAARSATMRAAKRDLSQAKKRSELGRALLEDFDAYYDTTKFLVEVDELAASVE